MKEPTLLELVSSFGVQRPGEVATTMTVLKNIALPFLVPPGPARTGVQETLEAVPAHAVYSLLDTDQTAWCEPLRRRLPQGGTYQKAYFRSVKRLVAHGEAMGLIHPEQYLIAPRWRDLIKQLPQLLGQLSPRTRSAARWAFRRLAKWATTEGLDPSDIPVLDDEGQVMLAFKESFPSDRDGGFYQARRAWNLLVASGCTAGLTYWPPSRSSAIRGIARQDWPASLVLGFEDMMAREGLGAWSKETRRGYEYRLSGYLGALQHEGIDACRLLAAVSGGREAFRLLFQGIPAGLPPLEATELAARFVTDEEYRHMLLSRLAEMEGLLDGRRCEANPLLVSALSVLATQGKITSARNLAIKALAVSRNYLGLAEHHLTWLIRRISWLDRLARRSPTVYARKKRAVFRVPDLWEALVSARPKIRAATAQLEREWRAASGTRAAYIKRRWAVALRNELILGLMLCYPLRVGNMVTICVGRNYDPVKYRIMFEAEETKNDREIDYELPDGGALGDLRELLDHYLKEARPVLLAGRRSPYLFVPDPRGGLKLRPKGINAILQEMSRRFLADVLPPELDYLNPHLLRHAAASYHLVIGQNMNLAAQMLNDSPITVAKNYADVLESKREATKRFLSGFEPKGGHSTPAPPNKQKRRQTPDSEGVTYGPPRRW